MYLQISQCVVTLFALTFFGQLLSLQGGQSDTDPFTSLSRNRLQRQQKERKRKGASIGKKKYKILTSKQIFQQLKTLSQTYPNYATLESSQDAYGLQAAGSEGDCPFDHDKNFTEGCKNYILTIEDRLAHRKGSTSWQRLPEVFLSGALHGNERIGPTAVTEVASFLLEAASCEAKPHRQEPDEEEEKSQWFLEIQEGRACRKELYKKGVDLSSRKWLARLVTTRRIVIMPSANALGYFRNTREEDGIDPNRDFPYDLKDNTKCMQTITGRSINEVFRDHMFQLSLTFHAGMEMIGYEWGAPHYGNFLSPDDVAQNEISSGYSRFAGGFASTSPYPTGTMNEKVYPVRGGMEDWAYAGSWDPKRVIQCRPKTYNAYPPKKTMYNNSTLRVFNMLVETSNSKIPKSNLGTSEGVFYDVDTVDNGHITRNIRLSLSAIDLVQPFAAFVGVNGVSLTDDIIPGRQRDRKFCEIARKSKRMLIPHGQNAVIEWTVGGGFNVDYSKLLYAKWEDVPETIDGSYMVEEEMGLSFTSTKATKGRTHWHADGADPLSYSDVDDGKFAATAGPKFSASIDTKKFKPGDTIAVFALAKVDQGWLKRRNPEEYSPNSPPMSHVVNTRTNPDWLHESAGKIIQGHKDWFSAPLTLVISKSDRTETVELSNRFKTLEDLNINPIDNAIIKEKKGSRSLILITVSVFVSLLSLVMIFFLRSKEYKRKRIRLEESDDPLGEDDDFCEEIQLKQIH